MEAEQLIQDKEWGSLTDAERAAVFPLAADEQEFNLLKKMLLVAQTGLEDVPRLSAGVHQRLREAVAARERRIVRLPRWSYAAAAVLVLAVASWIFLHQSSRKPGQPVTPGYAHADKKTRPADTSVQATPPPQVVKITKPAKPRPYRSSHKITWSAPLPFDPPAIVLTRINTSVGANPSLMDLVAEAY